ncbi:MAG TPA: hypothetical protein VFP50_20250 [Anaeromyxobacteraceae bacterium]|nr:hypothetical protein [Anaeromyxobacteraceae bacterium]
MTRRDLLRAAATSAAALALPAGCAAGPETLRPGPSPSIGIDPRLARLLSLAALAPSSHNVQPWTVRLAADGRLLVGLDPSRRLPEVDPAGRELAISIGCFLENLAQAAAAERLRAEVELLADPGALALAAVRLLPGPADGPGGAAAPARIRRRRTLRSGHVRRPLARADLDAVLALAGPEARFVERGSPGGRLLAEATVEAMRQQSDRDPAQAELARWMRFGDAELRRTLDGLTVDGLEVGGLAGFVMRHLFDERSAMKPGFREKGIERCAEQVGEGAGFLLLPAEPSRQGLVEAGRRHERVALALRERSIAGHPMSQALEEAPWRDTIAADLGLDRPVQLAVRLGYVDRYPEPVSPRRPVAAFVVAAALLLTAALPARAAEPAERPVSPSAARTTLSADLVARAAPAGLYLALSALRRWDQPDGDSLLLRGRYLQAGVAAGSSPSLAQAGLFAEWVPLAPLQLRLQYDALLYYGAFGSLVRLPSASAPFGPAALRALDGTEESALGHRLLATPVLRARLGRLVLRNETQLALYRLPARGAFVYDAEYDTLLASRDAVVSNRLAALWEAWRGPGDALLLAGPAWEVTHSGKAGLTRQRAEAVLFWSPADRLGPFARPRIFGVGGVNVRDRNRQGDPFAVVGAGADLDL